MSVTIALLALVLLLLAALLLRPSPALSTPRPIPVSPPSQSLQTRHVSFSLVATETSYSLERRWSSSLHKPKSSAPDSPQPDLVSVDQFGRIPPSPEVHSSPKLSRRFSTPLRLSFTGRRRSSSASLIHPDQLDTRTPSPSTAQSPLQRTRFVNPFTKRPRSRTLSPPSSASKSRDTSSSSPSGASSPSSPRERRRALVNKFKSIFKSNPPEPSPIIYSKPIFTTINTKLRRKPVARTQPYGPPWNAPMPVLDLAVTQYSLENPARTMSPPLQTSRKHSVNQDSRSETTLLSPGQLSPRTFINELDDKLSLL